MLRWLTPHFLFYPYPGPLSALSVWLLPAFFVALIVLGIVAMQLKRKAADKAGASWWASASAWLWTFGLVGLLATFFAWQRAPYLSSRIVLVAVLFCLALAAGWMAWKWFKQLPARRSKVQQYREYVKYLPSRKS
jgi:uncharacterized membrane protein